MTKRIKVLSIDGGGVYGIVSAMVLAEIEKMTAKPVAELFDFISGTSTGGLITLGLTKPGQNNKPRYTAADMVHLYEAECKNIFSRTLLHKIMALGHLIDEKYPSDGIDEVLHRYFGDTSLSELLTNVLIPAYDIERRRPYFFKGHKAKNSADRDFLIRDVARATSAAPSYFEPAKIATTNKEQTYVLIDGGVFANHPAMCAYAEVKAMYPGIDEITMVSLGIAGAQKPYRYENAKDWGTAQWLLPLLESIGDGTKETVDYQLQHIFMVNPSERNTYTRIQVPMPPIDVDFDDARPESIRLLKEYADDFIDHNQLLLENLAKQLS